MKYVWHYTVIEYLPKIRGYGMLLPSNASAEGELPLLWFSANQEWEPTAAKPMRSVTGRLVTPSMREVFEQGRAIRFGLPSDDPRLLCWFAACKYAGTPRRMREAMERVGIQQGGNPKDWYATTDPIPVGDLEMQAYQGKWLRVEENTNQTKMPGISRR